jgi:hypothetical protein
MDQPSSQEDKLQNPEKEKQTDAVVVEAEITDGKKDTEQPTATALEGNQAPPNSDPTEVAPTEDIETVTLAHEQQKIETVPDVPKEPEKPPPVVIAYLTLVIRPKDKEWIMGDDWQIRIDSLSTLNDLRQYIEENNPNRVNISRHRIQLRLKQKVPSPSRDLWTLRKLGVFEGTVIGVEPTMSGSWFWHDYDYYASKTIDEVCAVVKVL